MADLFGETMNPRREIEESVSRVIREYRPVLAGLAHYDEGKKVGGCDCCYCEPRAVGEEVGA